MKNYFKIISIICLAVFLGFGVFTQDAFASVGKCATSSAEAESLMGGSNLYICAPATDISENFCDPGEIPYACIETIPTPATPPTAPTTTPSIPTVNLGGCDPVTGQGCIDESGLVPCGPRSLGFRHTCTVCDFFVLIDKIIDFISIDIVPPLALLLIIVGGIMMIVSGGSETQYKKGKTIITSAIVGLLIIWGSWIIIDVIMSGLTSFGSQGLTPWNTIQCN